MTSSDGAFLFYLSAFLSAARSVRDVLRAEQPVAFRTWYPQWKASLADEHQARWEALRKQRIATFHLKGPDVSHRNEPISALEYLAAASREGMRIEISSPLGVPLPTFNKTVRTFSFSGSPEVVAESERFLQLSRQLVDDFVHHCERASAT